MLLSPGAVREQIRPWDAFVSNAGIIAVVDAVLAGVLAGFVAGLLGASMESSAAIGVAGGVLVLGLLLRYLASTWRQASRAAGVRFPSEGDRIDRSHIPDPVPGENGPPPTA